MIIELISKLEFIISKINYGGHVTDTRDMRVLNTYIEDLFKEEVIDPQMQYYKLTKLLSKTKRYLEKLSGRKRAIIKPRRNKTKIRNERRRNSTSRKI